MDRAIWAIAYDLGADGREEYLDWFHRVHIPEKLARPGYVWAAHYRLVAADPAARAARTGPESYLALFAGTASRVFFDPTLSELKARQDDLTRRMISCRSGAQAFILAEEWREEMPSRGAVAPAVVDLALFDLPGGDEAVGAWATKEVGPRIKAAAGAAAMRKLVGVQGPARHGVLLGFERLADRDAAAHEAVASERGRQIQAGAQTHPRSPIVGTRVWPA